MHFCKKKKKNLGSDLCIELKALEVFRVRVHNILLFLVIYEWPQKARVLHYNWLERQARYKHYSLFGPFVSYEYKEV